MSEGNSPEELDRQHFIQKEAAWRAKKEEIAERDRQYFAEKHARQQAKDNEMARREEEYRRIKDLGFSGKPKELLGDSKLSRKEELPGKEPVDFRPEAKFYPPSSAGKIQTSKRS